jgi:hypothetical protein
VIRLWLLTCLSCWGWFLSAQAAPDAPAPDVRPPVVQNGTDVPYPESARGEATVLLELRVESDGSVSAVYVLEGAEPFAEQARSAALGWRFQPALRGDAPIAARLRARIDFREPAEPVREAPTTAPTAANAASAEPITAPEEPIAEVVVRGERREIGQATLSAADVREMPGAFGDPFRAIEALPSVTPILSGLPYFFIRGAPPNDNGYFLDGIRIPLLFHVALGPGVIHPGLLERVDFHPGPAPASYGGFAGAIIAGHTRPPAESAHTEAHVRLVDAGALIEAPFGEGRGSALIAGRYGYPGPVVSAFSETRLGYWDYQARASWQLSEDDTIGVLAFGSHDFLGHEEASGKIVEDLVSDFHRIDARYDRVWSDGQLRLGATLGHDSQGSDPTYLTDRSAALRLTIEQQLASVLLLRAGAEGRIDDYGIEQGTPADPNEAVVPSNAEPPPTNLTAAAHADVIWRVVPRVEVVPGVRVALFDSARPASADAASTRTTVPAVEPRLSLRVSITPLLTGLASFGVAHQYPVLRVGAVPAPVAAGSGFLPGSSRLQRTLQVTQGVELRLPAAFALSVTGFLSRSSGLTDLTTNCLQLEPPTSPPGAGPRPDDPYFCPSNAPVKGRAHGLELSLRRSLSERLSGWLSYTLSRSVRQSRFLTLDGSEAIATVPSDFDRTHLLNAVLAYDLGRRWRAGSRLVLYSGAPYSELAGNIPVPPYNSRRDPVFFRLDLRLEKRWQLGADGSIAFVLEGQNVTLSRETNSFFLNCTGVGTPELATNQCERGKVGPITIPSVGVEAQF